MAKLAAQACVGLEHFLTCLTSTLMVRPVQLLIRGLTAASVGIEHLDLGIPLKLTSRILVGICSLCCRNLRTVLSVTVLPRYSIVRGYGNELSTDVVVRILLRRP